MCLWLVKLLRQHKNDLKPAMNISKSNAKCAYAEKNFYSSRPKRNTRQIIPSELDLICLCMLMKGYRFKQLRT